MIKEGQLCGPFEQGDIKNLFPSRNKVKFGVTMDEKDWMIYGDPILYPFGFYFTLNGERIEVGRTGVYEVDDFIKVDSFVFPFETPNSIKIDFIFDED